jgi:DNA-binding NarL/FixJ family response regulator
MTAGVGLLLSDDLIFTSKVLATARANGGTVRVGRSCDNLLTLAQEHRPTAIILDLHFPQLDLQNLLEKMRVGLEYMPLLVGYGSHVDVATLKAARQAGLDRVMPRSQFVDELETALPQWLTSQG